MNITELISSYLNSEPGSEMELEHALTNMELSKQKISSTWNIKTSLMFTDIVDSSNIYDSFGDEYGRELVALHDKIVKPIIERRGGKFIKGTGDGILASFESCGRSIKTAILIQQALEKHSGQFPLLPVMLRVGINVGEVIDAGHDLYGSSVNLAARITDIASPGAIFVTGIVYQRCKEKEYEFASRGSQLIKGFEAEIPLYEVMW
jgi:adenylate cyclase